MVIKESAAKRDGERLHPSADVEQESKERKRGDGRERMGCAGARTGGEKKTESRERAKENGRAERER